MGKTVDTLILWANVGMKEHRSCCLNVTMSSVGFFSTQTEYLMPLMEINLPMCPK